MLLNVHLRAWITDKLSALTTNYLALMKVDKTALRTGTCIKTCSGQEQLSQITVSKAASIQGNKNQEKNVGKQNNFTQENERTSLTQATFPKGILIREGRGI